MNMVSYCWSAERGVAAIIHHIFILVIKSVDLLLFHMDVYLFKQNSQYTYSCTCSAAWNKQWILLYSTSGCNRAWLWITSRFCRRKLRFQLFGSWIWLSAAHFYVCTNCIYYLLFSCNAIHIIATRIRLKSSDLNTKHELKVCMCVCVCVCVCDGCVVLWLWLWLSAFRSPSSSLTLETFHLVFLLPPISPTITSPLSCGVRGLPGICWAQAFLQNKNTWSPLGIEPRSTYLTHKLSATELQQPAGKQTFQFCINTVT